jgi:hypothetical protein
VARGRTGQTWRADDLLSSRSRVRVAPRAFILHHGAAPPPKGFWVNLGNLGSAQLANQSRAERQSAGESDAALPPRVDYQEALHAMYRSREDAKAADQVLFDAINRELSLT